MKFVLVLLLVVLGFSDSSTNNNYSNTINDDDNTTTTINTTTTTQKVRDFDNMNKYNDDDNMNKYNDITKRYTSSELQESLLMQRIVLVSSSLLLSLLSVSSSSLKTSVDIFVTVFNNIVVMITKSLRVGGDILKDTVTILLLLL